MVKRKTELIIYTDKHKIPFQIDEEDYEIISRYTWCIDTDGYPMTNIRKYHGGIWVGHQAKALHLFLLGKAPNGLQWDHENRDKLDNRRKNIRMMTDEGNKRNRDIRPENKSGYPGIYRYSDNNYGACIRSNRILFNLGRFKTFEEAVIARKVAEEKHWGSER